MSIRSISAPTVPGYGNVVASYSDATAGAIQSLTWMGKEFIDRLDHGRLLQSAVSFDTLGEANNPTEGGSALNGYIVSTTSSVLLLEKASAGVLSTAAKMANWNPVNGAKCSNTVLVKQLTLGFAGTWNAIEHRATFVLPETETHTQAQFEYLTGYMPLEFASFFTLDLATGALAPLSNGPGEQPLPVVFSTADGQWAMGCYSPAGTPGGGYGRWNEGDCVKWNAVSRVSSPKPGGSFTFRTIVAFGSRADVAQTLTNLAKRGV